MQTPADPARRIAEAHTSNGVRHPVRGRQRATADVRASAGTACPGGGAFVTPRARPNQPPLLNSIASTTSESAGRGGGEPTIESLQIELQQRDVQAPVASLLQTCSLQSIARTIEWWDARSGAGPGVLVEAIRKGGVTAQSNTLDRQQAYGEQISDWLNEHFPALKQASGRPHPAAIAAVIALHYEHGKGSLTPGRHGAEIRGAVRAWGEKWQVTAAGEGGGSDG